MMQLRQMTGKVHSLSYFSLIGENDKLYCIFFSVFGFCWFYSCFYEMVVGHIIVRLICVLFVHPHMRLYWRRFPLTSCVLNELPVTTNYNHTTGEFSIIPLTDYQINLDWGRFKKKNPPKCWRGDRHDPLTVPKGTECWYMQHSTNIRSSTSDPDVVYSTDN